MNLQTLAACISALAALTLVGLAIFNMIRSRQEGRKDDQLPSRSSETDQPDSQEEK